MHTGPCFPPQPSWGLTCCAQLPLSLPQYIQFILLPVDISLDKNRLTEISFPLSCLPLPAFTARGQMQGNGAPGGCQRGSYSWKALSHFCSYSHDLRRQKRESMWTWLCGTGLLFRLFFFLKTRTFIDCLGHTVQQCSLLNLQQLVPAMSSYYQRLVLWISIIVVLLEDDWH